jgi:TMEM175 potassium channel family protein
MSEDDIELEPDPSAARTAAIDRIVFFSDAVFAIAMTLLVLPLVGGRSDLPVWDQIKLKAPEMYAFALSFWVIGLYWLGHHRVYRRVRAYDEGLMLLNLLQLFCVAFLPYPTALSGRYSDDVASTVFYAASMTVLGLVTTLHVWYVVHHRRFADVDDRTARRMLLRGLAVPIVFLPTIPIAFANVTVARSLWWSAFLIGYLFRGNVPRGN